MKKIIRNSAKNVAKGASEIGSSVIKQTLASFLSDIAKEMIKEHGMEDVAKDMIVETGFNVVKSLNLDTNALKRDFVMAAIRRELNL